jgi:hypothetical protein
VVACRYAVGLALAVVCHVQLLSCKQQPEHTATETAWLCFHNIAQSINEHHS